LENEILCIIVELKINPMNKGFIPPAIFLLLMFISVDCHKKPDEPQIVTYNTFNQIKLNGAGQSSEQTFSLPDDVDRIKKIQMYVRLLCPSGGCGAWDVYANVLVKDNNSGLFYEMARYITPYGRDNSSTDRGFVFDVTDFKSLLSGEVTLRIFTEVWTSQGWLVSVDFDFEYGTPDYRYYSIAPVMQYNAHSLAGLPYGEATEMNVDFKVDVPDEAEETSLRTIISGWGHATPEDTDGRPCAEWCFRTHNVLIDDQVTFIHDLTGLGCEENAVPAQFGNWKPDRAGWCPGMEVPVRKDILTLPKAGQSFNLSYRLENWTNDFLSLADNKHAYYAVSMFVVVKSDIPVQPASISQNP